MWIWVLNISYHIRMLSYFYQVIFDTFLLINKKYTAVNIFLLKKYTQRLTQPHWLLKLFFCSLDNLVKFQPPTFGLIITKALLLQTCTWV